MSERLLYSIYQYYQLEGIPPYPSFFIPIDFYIVNWTSLTDLHRFRREKHYIAQDFTPGSGIVYYVVSLGLGETRLRRTYWSGQLFGEEQAFNENGPGSFDEWLEKNIINTNEYIERSRKRDLASVREAVDNLFGPVQIVTTRGIVQASDLYLGKPIEVEQKFDIEMMRLIERTDTVLFEDNNRVLHRRYRLQKWEYLQAEEIPNKLFDPDHIIGLEGVY